LGGGVRLAREMGDAAGLAFCTGGAFARRSKGVAVERAVCGNVAARYSRARCGNAAALVLFADIADAARARDSAPVSRQWRVTRGRAARLPLRARTGASSEWPAEIGLGRKEKRERRSKKELLDDAFYKDKFENGDEDEVENESEDENENEEEQEATIYDELSGRELECIISANIVVDNIEYAVCYPRDQVVVIATLVSEGFEAVLTAVEEEAVLDKLFPSAYAVLAEADLALIRSAYVLTVGGYDDEDDSDNDDGDDWETGGVGGTQSRRALGRDHGSDDTSSTEFELGSDEISNTESDRDAHEGEDEDEDVEVLAEFYYRGVEYMVCKPLEPVMFVARRATGGRALKLAASSGADVYVVPDKDELDRVVPFVEAELESRFGS